MRKILFGVALATIVGAASTGSYWLGRTHTDPLPQMNAFAPAQAADRQPSYYQDPSGKPDYSPVPKKDSMGMDFVPVYEVEEDNGSPQSTAATASKAQGKILYYRNPMGLPDTSPVPKKDSMGMEYLPVYDGDEPDDGSIKVSVAKVQKLGVRSERAEMRQLTRTIRAVGTVQTDERSLYAVNAKFEGWIEKLHVNTTGEIVHRGQPLMEVYAPELVAIQEEYILALRSQNMLVSANPDAKASAWQLANAALERLRTWGIPDDQIKRLQRTVTASRTLTLRAPADGIVMEKMAVEGQRFMPGELLYRIADLSTVWLMADVFEQDLSSIHEGETATAKVAAYPGADFTGKVAFIYPTVNKDTRTAKIRIVVPNPDGRLKTDMFANVELAAPITGAAVVAVPDSALLDSGTRQAVLIDRGDGRFEPREVKVGAKADGFYEITQGLSAGENVVVGANFLIDAESNIKAALKAFTSSQKPEKAQ
jgi:Cu(I)/Ag(I) efflux system membrane fusion protein